MILEVSQNIKTYNFAMVIVPSPSSFDKSVTAVLQRFVFLPTLLLWSALLFWTTRPFLNTINMMNLTDLLGPNVSLAYGWHHCQAPQTIGTHSTLYDRDISNLGDTSA